MTTPPRCEQFCTEPLDADGEVGGPDWRNCCSSCARIVDWLSHDVLPAIRKHGYYAPAADVDGELRALIEQAQLRPQMREALAFLDDVPTADGRALGDLWATA